MLSEYGTFYKAFCSERSQILLYMIHVHTICTVQVRMHVRVSQKTSNCFVNWMLCPVSKPDVQTYRDLLSLFLMQEGDQ